MGGAKEAYIRRPYVEESTNVLYQIIIFCHYQTTRRRLILSPFIFLINIPFIHSPLQIENMVRISILATLACMSACRVSFRRPDLSSCIDRIRRHPE
jgi:hypothetical protein